MVDAPGSGRRARVRIRIHANAATTHAVLTLAFPDARAQPAHGPRGVDTLRAWQGNLAAGETVEVERSVGFPGPGYYRVIALVRDVDAPQDGSEAWGGSRRGAPDASAPPPTHNAAVGEAWIHVGSGVDSGSARGEAAGRGGVAGAAVATANPGPAAESPAQVRPTAVACDESGCYDPPPPGGSGGGVISGTAYYYDYVRAQWEPQANATVRLGAYATRTDAAGAFSIEGCPAAGQTARLSVQSVSPDILQLWDGSAVIAMATVGESACWSPVSVYATSTEAASLYRNMLGAVDASRARLGPDFVRTAQLRVEVATGDPETSTYYPTEDVLQTNREDAIYTEGVYAAAHEYGHSVHQTRLGGLHGYQSGNCGTHWLEKQTTLGCAWLEGYAAFHAVAALSQEAGYRAAVVDQGSAWNHNDGSRVEGAVAAFLLDLVDPKGYDVVTNARHFNDDVALPPAYLAAVIRGCRIRVKGTGWVQSAYGKPIDGVDYLTYCLERATAINESFTSRRCPKTELNVGSSTACSMPSSSSTIKPRVDATSRDYYFAAGRGPEVPTAWADPFGTFLNGGQAYGEPYTPPERLLWRCDLFGRCDPPPSPTFGGFDLTPTDEDAQITPDG